MKKLTAEQYESLKNDAYNLAVDLTKEQLEQVIDKANFSDKEAGMIYKNTLMYPNDLEIIQEYFHSNQRHNITQISQTLNIPSNILAEKAAEYGIYNTTKLLNENPELRRLAGQASQFTGDYIKPQIGK